jgi:hypothetical protein
MESTCLISLSSIAYSSLGEYGQANYSNSQKIMQLIPAIWADLDFNDLDLHGYLQDRIDFMRRNNQDGTVTFHYRNGAISSQYQPPIKYPPDKQTVDIKYKNE